MRRRVERVGKVPRALVPRLRVAGECPLERGVDHAAAPQRQRNFQRGGVACEPLTEHLERAPPAERWFARRQLEKHTPQAVEITAPVDRIVRARLLGTHVERRPHHQPRLRQILARRRIERARHAKVGDHDVPPFHQNILRLDVAVHQPLRMRVVQRVAHFASDAEDEREGQPAIPLETRAQRTLLEVGHHVVQQPVRFPGIQQRQDVRMPQPRHDGDLTQKPLRPERLGQLRLQHFERHQAIHA